MSRPVWSRSPCTGSVVEIGRADAELPLRRDRRGGRRSPPWSPSGAIDPDRIAPWLLMAFGQALFVAGDLIWNWYEIIGEDPFPSMADGLYLAGYPFIALGLLLLIRRRLAGGDRGGLARRGDPDHGRRHPVVDVLHPAAARRDRPRRAQPGHQPRLPGRRPAPHRRRHGPPDDAGRADGVVPPARRQPPAAARGRPDLRAPEPRGHLRRRWAHRHASTCSRTSCSAPRRFTLPCGA